MNRVRQFWCAAKKVFDLPRRLRGVRDGRSDPLVPTFAVNATLFLGALLRKPSFLQLQFESARRGWQRLIAYAAPISDDRMVYVCERYRLEDWRAVLVSTNQTLKGNKAFESAKIHGLLVVAIDGNEQFKSRSRCCAHCCQRQIKIKNRQGQIEEVTEYYHRFVCAQLHGPNLNVVLDLEPIRPGEEEAAAALRLLGRMRRLYGPRFFDAVTVDAWYATGPFIKAVQRLGWGVIAVLKQERYEIYQEATALMNQAPPTPWKWEDRQIELREVKQLPFTDPGIGLMRVVQAREHWSERHQQGGKKTTVTQQSFWRWLVSPELDGIPAQGIWRIGHARWGIENHVFNELTQHYHLEHCPHHQPMAIVAWLLILVLAFNLFEWFVRSHGKLWRAGAITLRELAQQLDRALERFEELEPLWSG
jgi:Transposase DDE domain